jgi:hypothetical protein
MKLPARSPIGLLDLMAVALVLVGCVPGQHVDIPADDVLHVATDQAKISVQVPYSVRGQTRRLSEGVYYFGTERSSDHTVVAYVDARVIEPARRGAVERSIAGKSDREVLDDYLREVEPLERTNPGRLGNVLRSYERVGGTRPAQGQQGVVCGERVFVAEDRQVPGHHGRPFLYHGRYYTCIDPRTHLPVQIGWTERYPIDGDRLSPSFEAEAGAFFDSLRFD